MIDGSLITFKNDLAIFGIKQVVPNLFDRLVGQVVSLSDY